MLGLVFVALGGLVLWAFAETGSKAFSAPIIIPVLIIILGFYIAFKKTNYM